MTTLDLALADRLRTDLLAQGFACTQPPHTIFAARKPGLACTLYASGKLVIQGKQAAEFVEFYLEPQLLGSLPFTKAKQDYTPRIGCDEAGKGDYFGPLCIAGIYGESTQIETLEKLGIADSKKLSDRRIPLLAREIRTLCPHHIITLRPEKYNELYEKFRNLNHLLAWAHAAVIETLVKQTGAQEAVVDQFAHNGVLDRAVARKKLSVQLRQVVRAESSYLVVAAASILARGAFLTNLQSLSASFQFPLPKGSGSPVPPAARQFILQHGRESLGQVAKLHFRITEQL